MKKLAALILSIAILLTLTSCGSKDALAGTWSAEFEYDGVIYLKSQELQDIEERNARVNWLLLLVLCAMFLTAIKWQNIVVIALGMVVIVAGELFRMSRLPKDIKAHLTDSGRRKL